MILYDTPRPVVFRGRQRRTAHLMSTLHGAEGTAELEATGHVYRTGSQREGYRWFATAAGEARSRRDATPPVIVDILDSLRTIGEATTADLAEHTGRTRKHVHNALRRAGITPARIERNRLAVWRTP